MTIKFAQICAVSVGLLIIAATQATSQTTDEINAQATALQALASAENAKTAADTSRLAALKEAVPASSFSNSASMGKDAGGAEVNYLTATGINSAAKSIGLEIATKAKCPAAGPAPTDVVAVSGAAASAPSLDGRVAILPASTTLDFSHVSLYEARLSAVEKSLVLALENAAKVTVDDKTGATKGESGIRYGYYGGGITAVLPSILSYLNSVDDLELVQASKPDTGYTDAVAGQLIGKYCAVTLMDANFASVAAGDVGEEWALISARVSAASTEMDRLSDFKSKRGKDAYQGLSAAVTAAAKLHDDVFGAKDAAATLPISTVVREKALKDAIQYNYVLMLSIESANGSAYSQKNIGTLFGGDPYAVSTTVVLSYSLLNGRNGRMMAAGMYPVASGYTQVKKVKSSQ